MKKRVFSILLALALCLTLLPAAAWAEETGTNGDETCTHTDWEYIDDEEGQRHIQQCKNCPQKQRLPIVYTEREQLKASARSVD